MSFTREDAVRIEPLVDLITSVLDKVGASPRDGELACAWVCGASIGIRAESLKEADAIEAMAQSWQMGAAEGN